jgi:GT2 family glycosyltransferase
MISNLNIYKLLAIDSDMEFINKSYQLILKRPADSEGFEYYQAMLSAGMKRVTVIKNIAVSKEASKLNADLFGINYFIFKQRLKKIGAEISNMPQKKYTDVDLLSAVNFLELLNYRKIDSMQIAQTLLSLNNNVDFIKNLFKVALGRGVDANALNHFIGLLSKGHSRLYIIKQVYKCQEANTYLLEKEEKDIDEIIEINVTEQVELKPEYISFTRPENPKVSIIIPVYGQINYTLRCLQSIQLNKPIVDFEIIVMDDASPDDTFENLSRISGITIVRNDINLGFIRNCNKAVQFATGQYIYFLNNDTQVTKGWLDALVNVFEQNQNVGLVGSRLIYPDGKQQEAGGIVWSDASAWNYGRLADPLCSEYSYLHEADYISGASIMIPLNLFKEMGGFDELYLPAYCEDTDFAFRVRKSGLKVYYQPASIVIHYEGITHGKETSGGIKAYQVENQAKFHERWSDILKINHFQNGEEVFLSRDRSQLKKIILVIDHYVPQFDQDAGSRTMMQFMQIFKNHDMSVKFWPQNLWYDPTYTPVLQQKGVEVIYGAEYVDGFDNWIQRNGIYIDYVLLSRPHISIEFIDSIRKHTKARVLYYGHDVHHLRLREQLNIEGDNSEINKNIEQVKLMEEDVWKKVDTIYYPAKNETDYVCEWLRKKNGTATALTIPVYAFDNFPDKPWENLKNRKNLIFVAGFAHKPNEDAALWFVKKVLPLIHAVRPDIHLYLVGSNPSQTVISLANNNVTVTGFVSEEELSNHYIQARVVVAPLRFGGGMKGKIVESMRFAIPCVTTPTGAQGFMESKDILTVSEDEQSFADKVLWLLSNDEAWYSISKASQDFARTNFSEDTLWQILAKDINPCLYDDVETRRKHISDQRIERKN